MNDYLIDLKVFRKSIYASQIIITALGLSSVWFFLIRKSIIDWSFILTVESSISTLISSIIVAVMAIVVQICLYMLVPHDLLIDEINKLFYKLSYAELFIIFVIGSFAEEILFRGSVQTSLSYFFGNIPIAILGSSLAFAVFHIRYLRKPVLLVTVIIFGGAFGWLFVFTGTLWAPVLAHFLSNYIMVCLGKKGLFVPKKE